MATSVQQKTLEGKVIIITGANTGIGYETALDLAHRGAQIILACRDLKRGQDALDKIKKETKNELVFLEELNLSDFDSVRSFAKRFLEKTNRLDILINNAGLINGNFEKCKHGTEMTITVNHLGHFLLTNLLLDILKKSAPSRIINVSSAAYRVGKINWDDINMEKNYSGFNAYCQSKIANIFFTLELAKRLQETNVTPVALHPGTVKTEIFRNSSGFIFTLIKSFASVFAKTPKQGAKTTIYCAISPQIPNNPGAFYDDSKIFALAKDLIESPDAARLWELSEKLVELK